jgi:ABC-type glycerol-3-phosphate transport system substrate-binding protein
MKRIIVFLLAILTVMAACSKNSGSSSKGLSNVTIGPDGRFTETVHITQSRVLASWMGFDSGENEDKNWWTRTYKEQLNVELTNLFTAPNWGSDYDTKINIALVTNQLPDVMSLYTSLAAKAIQGGKVMDLTEIYEKYASDQVKEIYANEPAALAAWKVGGKLYGLPNTAETNSWTYFWVPKSYIDEFRAGVLPTTFAQVEELAVQIARKTRGYGFGLDNQLHALENIADAFHATTAWILKDGELEWGRLQPEIKATWEKMAEWYQKGLLARDFASKLSDDVDADFLNGRCAMMIDRGLLPNGIGRNWKLLHPDDDLVCIPIMAADGRELRVVRRSSYENAIMISSTCKNPAAVMSLFNLGTAISNDFGKPDFIKNANYDWSPNGNMNFWNRLCTGSGMVEDRIPEHSPGYQAVLEIRSGGDGSRLADMSAFTALQFYKQIKSWIEEGKSAENWELNWSIWSIYLNLDTEGYNAKMQEEGRFIISPRIGQEVEAEATNNQNINAKYSEIATLAIMNNSVDRSFTEWVNSFYANGGKDIYEQVREQHRNQ